MVVIAAIGAFFKKIWDWIRQTAWIQPLLIVGLIFGAIFSIKPIVEAVKSSSEESKLASTYYHKFQKSLEGKENSDADKLTYTLEKVMSGEKNVDTSNIKNNDGERIYKFFLVYAAETCENCDAAKEGFEVLQENMSGDPKSIFHCNDGYEFNMITIFADQETEETEEKKTAFVHYLDRHQFFFESCASNGWQTPYKDNKPLLDADLEYLATADPDNFLTPTILLVELYNSDPSKEDFSPGHGFDYGVTEVMFGVEGETAHDKAKTLLDCWNHEGKFSHNA